MSAFIVADNLAIATRVREVLNFGGLNCGSAGIVAPEGALGRLGREATIDLVVVVLTADPEQGLGLIAGTSRIAVGKVFAVGTSTDPRLILRALRSGASDYIDSHDLEAELASALERRAEAARSPEQAGRLVAVVGPSGGAGASTAAANLAVALARETKTVALLDLRVDGGDQATLLNLRPTFTVADLCRNLARLDRDMFERSLSRHDSGVGLLAAPLHFEDAAAVRPEGIDQAIHLARMGFPYVVADVDPVARTWAQGVLRQADLIVLVFRLEFASLRNARRVAERLEVLGVDPSRYLLVVNRSGQPQEIGRSKAEEVLGRSIAHLVPEDGKAINRAGNNGVPVVIEAPSSKVAKSFVRLAGLVRERGRTA